METFLCPTHPVLTKQCWQTSTFNKLVLNIVNEYNKIYIYSPALRQDFYQKLIKCFSTYIPIHIIPNILKEEDRDIKTDEFVNNKDFEKSDAEIETYESKELLKFPQDYESDGIIILDDLNEKERKDCRVQAMFKRSRHKNSSILLISQDYYELPKKTTRAIGNIYHIFKPNNFRDVQNLYQDKASMDMTLYEFKYLTSFCWNKQF